MRSKVISLWPRTGRALWTCEFLGWRHRCCQACRGRLIHRKRLWGHFHTPVFASVAPAKWGRMRLEFGTLLIVFLSQCVGSVGNNKTILKIPFLGFLWKKNSCSARKESLLKRTQNSAWRGTVLESSASTIQ